MRWIGRSEHKVYEPARAEPQWLHFVSKVHRRALCGLGWRGSVITCGLVFHRDIAKVALAGMQSPLFRTVVSTVTHYTKTLEGSGAIASAPSANPDADEPGE